MSRKWLSGSIALSSLKSVITERKGQSGMVKGIFIPIDANYLTLTDKNQVYLNLSVGMLDEPDKYDQIGMVTHSIDSTKYKAMSEDERQAAKDAFPVLGNLKDFNKGGDSAPAAETVEAEDDLPF
jgi:hypothetical protein